MKRFITIICTPLFLIHLLLRFCTSVNKVCAEDQKETARCRKSLFTSEVMQFVYFMLWLPEYRSVFYMRCGFTPPPLFSCNNLYIRTKRNNIKGGMVINHGHSTEINAQSIGRNFHCFQNVTIGTKDSPLGPIIGDNVFVGTGAVVIGNIRIGNNVKIGANATIVKDVPDNCTIVSSGTYIVRKDGEKVHIKI